VFRALLLAALLLLPGCAEFSRVFGRLEPTDARGGCAPKGKLAAHDVRVGAICRF